MVKQKSFMQEMWESVWNPHKDRFDPENPVKFIGTKELSKFAAGVRANRERNNGEFKSELSDPETAIVTIDNAFSLQGEPNALSNAHFVSANTGIQFYFEITGQNAYGVERRSYRTYGPRGMGAYRNKNVECFHLKLGGDQITGRRRNPSVTIDYDRFVHVPGVDVLVDSMGNKIEREDVKQIIRDGSEDLSITLLGRLSWHDISKAGDDMWKPYYAMSYEALKIGDLVAASPITGHRFGKTVKGDSIWKHTIKDDYQHRVG